MNELLDLIDRNIKQAFLVCTAIATIEVFVFSNHSFFYQVLIAVGSVVLAIVVFFIFKFMFKIGFRKIEKDNPAVIKYFSFYIFLCVFYTLLRYPFKVNLETDNLLQPLNYSIAVLGAYWASRVSKYKSEEDVDN